MSRLLPKRTDDASIEQNGEPEIIGVDSEKGAQVIDALSSEMSRSIVSSLHNSPATPSELAEKHDTSVQNIRYHIENLEEAGVIEVDDKVYSSRGREMNVYSPADKPVFLYTGKDKTESHFKNILGRLFGVIGIIGLSSLSVKLASGIIISKSKETAPEKTVSVTNDAATSANNTSVNSTAFEGVERTADMQTDVTVTYLTDIIPPSILFFLITTTMILTAFCVWYLYKQ